MFAAKLKHPALAQFMIKDAQRQEPLVAVIASMLEETVMRNDEHQKQSNLTSFTGRKPPLSPCAFVTRCVSAALACLFYVCEEESAIFGVCL